jgi:UDP-N-acetylglucosamine transferase subunit ALG13
MSLDKSEFDAYFTSASSVIGHAGMGTITMALKHRKPLLVMPRLKKYREVVNDHQVGIARKFEEFGHILVAYGAAELPEKIDRLKNFIPTPREDKAQAVVNRIRCFLHSLDCSGKSV